MKSATRSATPPTQPVAAAEATRDAVAWEVARQLQDGAYPQLGRCVTCHFREGVLTLRGRVPSFYLKQFAQTVASKVHGVRAVQNEVVVEP